MECIESVLATTSLSAQAKGLTLTRSVEPDIQLQAWRHGDSHRIRQVLLNHGGYESTAADNGAQALALMNEMHFDLVLMDCQMPDIDGLEVTQRMRAGESCPR